MNKSLKKILPQVIIILFFVVFSYAYFYPILEGKVLSQMDFDHAIGTAQEVIKYQENNHRDVAWTNSLFGGMPTYHITGVLHSSIFSFFFRVITVLPYGTVSTLFLYLLGFYILLLTFKVDKWLSAVGAIAFALSSYNIIIIVAGHITKAYAIGFMPIVVAGFVLLYDKKYWLGTILSLLGLGMEIAMSHIQIVYYTAMAVGLFVLIRFIQTIKEKTLPDFFKASGFVLGIVLLVGLTSISSLWRSQEMGKYSIRGKSELTQNKNGQSQSTQSGLDKDYALAWSYGIDESFTLLIPNVKGGATGVLGYNEAALDKVNRQYQEYVAQQNHYWGDQPFTSGPVYLGAIIFFLFILGIFIVKDKIKWWILAATVLALMLSWGKNFLLLTDPFFYYFPYYNKFRTVSMILVIVSLTVPLMSFLTLKEIMNDREKFGKNLKPVWISLGITVLLLIIPSFFNFMSVQEVSSFDNLLKSNPQQASQINSVFDELQIARKSIYKSDALRSFAYVAIGALLLLAFVKIKGFKKYMFIGALGLFILIDLGTVSRRYLPAKNDPKKGVVLWKNKSRAKDNFLPKPVDQIIMKDTDKYYRVLNLTTSTFNDAYTSYFHKSIGGYHGAKLRRYQDVIDNYLGYNMQLIINSLQDTTGDIGTALKQSSVLNMLNTKYIIYNPQQFPIVNQNAYGNAWFVDNYKLVNTAQEELDMLATQNLKRTAIINKEKFDVSKLPELSYANDTTKYIKLTKYEPDRLEFEVNASKESFVVFSDIFYPVGWNAYVGDQKTDIYQVNYLLRGIVVPAGKNKILFEFKPAAVYVSKKIAFGGGFLVVLTLLFSGFMLYKNKKNTTEEAEIKKESK